MRIFSNKLIKICTKRTIYTDKYINMVWELRYLDHSEDYFADDTIVWLINSDEKVESLDESRTVTPLMECARLYLVFYLTLSLATIHGEGEWEKIIDTLRRWVLWPVNRTTLTTDFNLCVFKFRQYSTELSAPVHV